MTLSWQPISSQYNSLKIRTRFSERAASVLGILSYPSPPKRDEGCSYLTSPVCGTSLGQPRELGENDGLDFDSTPRNQRVGTIAAWRIWQGDTKSCCILGILKCTGQRMLASCWQDVAIRKRPGLSLWSCPRGLLGEGGSPSRKKMTVYMGWGRSYEWLVGRVPFTQKEKTADERSPLGVDYKEPIKYPTWQEKGSALNT